MGFLKIPLCLAAKVSIRWTRPGAREGLSSRSNWMHALALKGYGKTAKARKGAGTHADQLWQLWLIAEWANSHFYSLRINVNPATVYKLNLPNGMAVYHVSVSTLH